MTLEQQQLWKTAATACTPRQWQALVLLYAEELPRREAAHRLGIDPRALDRLIDRALRRLQHHADHERRNEARDEMAA